MAKPKVVLAAAWAVLCALPLAAASEQGTQGLEEELHRLSMAFLLSRSEARWADEAGGPVLVGDLVDQAAVAELYHQIHHFRDDCLAKVLNHIDYFGHLALDDNILNRR